METTETSTVVPPTTTTEPKDITQVAEEQLRQLDLETNLKTTLKTNTNGNKSIPVAIGTRNKSRDSSVTRQPKGQVRKPSSSGQTSGATSPEHVKKIPMNKIEVGLSPSPNVSKATSKIGSLSNSSYKPSGGKVKIENKKLQWKAESKIGSMSNLKHQPGGGDVKIETRKVEIKANSRIGSLSNVKYTPGGGDKKIFDDKEYLLQQQKPSKPETKSASKESNSSRRQSQQDVAQQQH